MAIDLVGLVSQVLTPQLVGSLARAVGINEAVAQKLVGAAIPVVLGALATTAAAPGGAQKLVDAVSNSDPDLLTKLSGAISGGNVARAQRRRQSDRRPARRLGPVEPRRRAEPILRRYPTRGPVDDRRRGAGGDRRDRPAGPVQLVGPVLDRRACSALRRTRSPPRFRAELSSALGATGLLAGLGGLGAAATRTASSAASSAASAASAATSAAARAPGGRELQRIPDVGDHSADRDRSRGDLVVHEPEGEDRAGEDRHAASPDRIRSDGGARIADLSGDVGVSVKA